VTAEPEEREGRHDQHRGFDEQPSCGVDRHALAQHAVGGEGAGENEGDGGDHAGADGEHDDPCEGEGDGNGLAS